ncbi:hypothetical protein [Vibrio tapetis]|uniref:DUF4153 domain-containing protein n=1 Tax=Vibrio tapetis subsp. tapetis TaxID=1671868 RepID=A0A2N8Z9F7_9VIBR|nr:hypothetical protein [Vibrio tapetis]SON48551.1 conserved membrane protein of unknown function [Vibrio tapetis subsp. tapetis]
MNDKIDSNLDNPEELERFYRQSPQQFEQQLNASLGQNPSNLVLRVWHALLNYRPEEMIRFSILSVLLLCLFASVFIKIPMLFDINDDWFFERFLFMSVALPLSIYFCEFSLKQRISRVLLGGFVLFALYFGFVPESLDSDASTMAYIHGPLLLLSFIGVSFVSSQWKLAESRLNYVRYLGEVMIYSILLLIGGMVLTGLTVGLFEAIGWDIHTWYIDYVVMSGIVSAPIVATYIYDQMLNRQSKFATVLSNVFSPLLLFTVSAYLLASVSDGSNPYLDREFLILFNGLMLVVWAITVFSISGKSSHSRVTKMDYVNIALIGVTLIINAIALSAIVYRWWEFGVSFNRIVVTGANVLIFTHLCLILRAYVRCLTGKGTSHYR